MENHIRILNLKKNSTTKVKGKYDRSLMSKRVRAMLNNDTSAEMLFKAIMNERNAIDKKIKIDSLVIEKISGALRDEESITNNDNENDDRKHSQSSNNNDKNSNIDTFRLNFIGRIAKLFRGHRHVPPTVNLK